MSEPLSWSDVAEHIQGQAALATVTADGRPHVAIVSPALVGDTVWIGTNRSSRKTANLTAVPSAALVWSDQAELYLWGDVTLVDDVDVKRSMWEDTWPYDPAMFFQTPDNPDYVLAEVRPQRAMLLSFTEQGPARRRWRP